MTIVNELSERYATPEMNRLFSKRYKILGERDFWIHVMRGQKALGADFDEKDILKFEKAKHRIDFQRIKELEKILKHDVKARLEAFIEVSHAKEIAHLGMTSRTLTDNVEQIILKCASSILFRKYVSTLHHFIDRAKEYQYLVFTGRSHHQPGELICLGKRFAMWAEELYEHLLPFERFIHDYPLRGMKGPMGTYKDMVHTLGSLEKARKLEGIVADHYGFSQNLQAPGQTYFRSFDLALLSHLELLSAACGSFATSMRLMAGLELVNEGFGKHQIGSSIMPHKMNTKNCERICSLAELVKMYAGGASRISGVQWEEGDVSDSAIRRVILPDSFYASDGICETTLTVLNQMNIYPAMIDREISRYLPLLGTTTILALAHRYGVGRERAHSLIKKYAVADVHAMRMEGKESVFEAHLAQDPIFKKKGITLGNIRKTIQSCRKETEDSVEQVNGVVEHTSVFLQRYQQEARYEPLEII